MNKWIMLGLAGMLAVSGCGAKEPPTAEAGVQSPAPGTASDAAAAANKAKPAPVEEAAKPADSPALSAESKSGNTTVDAKSQASAEAGPQAGKQEAAKPNASAQVAAPASSQAEQAPAAAAQASPAASAEQPAQDSFAAAAPKADVLTISITGDKDRGVILKEMAVPYQEGMTALDVLKQATKTSKLQMEFQGKGAYAYVQGIDNLYEFDKGPKSGWMYKVNGEIPNRGAGAYKLASGDKIEWLYTLNLGEDVGAKLP